MASCGWALAGAWKFGCHFPETQPFFLGCWQLPCCPCVAQQGLPSGIMRHGTIRAGPLPYSCHTATIPSQNNSDAMTVAPLSYWIHIFLVLQPYSSHFDGIPLLHCSHTAAVPLPYPWPPYPWPADRPLTDCSLTAAVCSCDPGAPFLCTGVAGVSQDPGIWRSPCFCVGRH